MADKIADGLENLQINENLGAIKQQNGEGAIENRWLFPLAELYKHALHFYKEKDGKGLHLSYKDKLRIVAYTKQASFGKYRPDVSPDVGFLDVVGSNRRQAWQSLGDMSKDTAMEEFVKMLDGACPLFKPYLQAQKSEQEKQAQLKKEEEERQHREKEESERKLLEEEAHRQLELEKERQKEQEKQIRNALNQQTAVQFKQYAEQQFPGNSQQQEELIVQLQDQHFQQYMQQVYQQQLLHQQQQYQQLQAMAAAEKTGSTEVPPTSTPQLPINQQNGPIIPPTVADLTNQNGVDTAIQNGEEGPREGEAYACPSIPKSIEPAKMWTHKSLTEFKSEMGECKDNMLKIGSLATATDDYPPIAAASMWTRKDVKDFKDSLKKDKDSVIKVGSGETVTVRVPTHEDGSCLFWEFATDYYDIGFGVYFEWTIAPSNTVSVHVSESSDEEDLDEEGEGAKPNDIEKGDKKDDRPPTDEIIPVYRRDCHEEVYCGSHAYPGQGVYLLKFDNSYSLWRSKTLYYRVYYSR